MSRVRPASSAGTLTVAQEDAPSSSSSSRPSEQAPQTLVLRLKRPKKKVTWKEGTVDNEFLNRRSSKKCCIFHKEKSFDEDASDDEDGAGGLGGRPGDDDGHAGPSNCCSHGGGGH